MELMEALATRRSVRKYLPTPVERATLAELMRAATLAPSAMNTQPWAFGVITDAAMLRDYSDRSSVLVRSLTGTLPWLAGYRTLLEDPEFDIFYGAPACIVIFGKPSGPAVQGDCAMAAQNLMLAARDRGLGTCWIGFFQFLLDNPEEKAALGVPADDRVIAPIIVGVPDGTVPMPERQAPEVVFWE